MSSHASRPVNKRGALYKLEMRKVAALVVMVQVATSREVDAMGLRAAVRSFLMYKQALGLASSVSVECVGQISVQFV